MHTVQVTVEDFASRNDGVYPINAASVTADGGLTLPQLLPGGVMPDNPFTAVPTVLGWGAAQGTPYGGADGAGGIQLNTWAAAAGAIDAYEVAGEDENGATLSLVLTNQ
jgi:hypothetical protein